MSKTAISLYLAPPSIPLKVVALQGGDGFRRRLAELGISPGVIVEICHRGGNGPTMIGYNGSRLALGGALCRGIKVKFCP